MAEDGFSAAERVIIRNQRYMMLAISAMFRNAGGMGSDYHAETLTRRVKDMERAYEWIASPNERL